MVTKREFWRRKNGNGKKITRNKDDSGKARS